MEKLKKKIENEFNWEEKESIIANLQQNCYLNLFLKFIDSYKTEIYDLADFAINFDKLDD